MRRTLHSPSPLLFLLALALPELTFAQTPSIGILREGDCETPPADGLAGEVFARKSTGGPWDDWQFHLFAKGAGGIGMSVSDFSGEDLQVLSGTFTRPEAPSDVVSVYATLPEGRLYLDSGDLASGFNFMGKGLVQTVGDGAALLAQAADVVLPGDGSEYWTELGDGPERFPRVFGGGIELAFGPVLDLAPPDQGLGDCEYGGAAADFGPTGRLIAGYNVYRMLDEGVVPSRLDIASPENWQDYVELDTLADLGRTFARWHDPDGEAFSGDEVLLYHDAELLPDGTPRPMGTAPDLSGDRAYWYAIQPVAPGDVTDWAWISVVGSPPADRRLDQDGDALFEAVDADGDGSPEFISPQAAVGRPGLGLTHGGWPLVSKVVLATPPAPDVGGSVRIGPGGRISWTEREGAMGYRVRRGTRPDFLAENPRLLSVDVVAEPIRPETLDDEPPPAGGVLYYRVSSIDRFGRESFEGALPVPTR